MTNINQIFLNLQSWLLGEGRCTGCGNVLGQFVKRPENGHFVVTCECSREFVWQPSEKVYRKDVYTN